uniref:RING-type domain-containing protein n=1 Tax=Anopheles farauti TaxID=69004 RepID=A0A182QBM9_9DIPT
MPATSYVRVHRKSLYYARPERTLYSGSDDIRTGWDAGGTSQATEDGKEKDSAEDERLESSGASELVNGAILPPAEQRWKLLDALNALSSWGITCSRPKTSLELTSLVERLVEHVVARRAEHIRKFPKHTTDGLCCPICEGVLRYPVTATCGHTFCRQCCFGHGRCTVCGQRFPSATLGTAPASSTSAAFTSTPSSSSSATVTSASYAFGSSATYGADTLESALSVTTDAASGGFELDILIRRLVERWWGPELKAADLNDEAQRHLEDNSLDEALRCCNQSLEQVAHTRHVVPPTRQTADLNSGCEKPLRDELSTKERDREVREAMKYIPFRRWLGNSQPADKHRPTRSFAGACPSPIMMSSSSILFSRVSITVHVTRETPGTGRDCHEASTYDDSCQSVTQTIPLLHFADIDPGSEHHHSPGPHDSENCP